MAKRSSREWKEMSDSAAAKKLKISLEDFYELTGQEDEDVLKTYEKIGGVVPRKYQKKGGSVRRKKGSTVSRKRGGKIMQGYKAGGKV